LKGNDPLLVEFEAKLALVIRANEKSYIDAISHVTGFWRAFVRDYQDSREVFGVEEASLLGKLRRPEFATPEFLGHAPASIQDERALRQWKDLVDSRLDSASVDLHMFFLRIVYDVFLEGKPLARSKQILGGNVDPERVRKLPAIKSFFKDRHRGKNPPPVTEAIIGNRAVIPERRGTAESILPPGDRARSALVERGADVQFYDPDYPVFYGKATALGLPLAAGISGSTADFIEMARIAGLQGKALHNFAMAILYYITLPGHHSFHEVATVLAAAGIGSYQPKPGIGDYSGPLTDEIKRSAEYEALALEYPGLLLLPSMHSTQGNIATGHFVTAGRRPSRGASRRFHGTYLQEPSPAAEGAAKTGEGIPGWGFQASSRDTGFRMNPAFWQVTYTVTFEGVSRKFRNSPDRTALQNVESFFGHPKKGKPEPEVDRIEVALREGVAPSLAARDLIAPGSKSQYSFECFTAVALVQFVGAWRGLHQTSPRTADAIFNQYYADFRVTLFQEPSGPQIRWGGKDVGENLDQLGEFTLRDLLKDPKERGLLRGDWVDLKNERFIHEGAFQYENTIYLGGKRFYGHPFGVFTIDQYIEHLRREEKITLSRDEILDKVSVRPRYRPPHPTRDGNKPR
jgi:protein-glutamine gamma-glutamyltransferase-like protein